MMSETKLTKHFSVAEFERSDRAKKLYKETKDPVWLNIMPDKERANAVDLCENVLEKVRAHFGMPIYISSGYRCPRLNAKVGGVTTSQHTKGQAADIYIMNMEMPLKAVCDWMVKHLDYDQIIWETRRSGSKWIHVSYVSGRNRHMALRCEDGKHYLPYRENVKIKKLKN
jgi:hypothetical protein